MRAKGFFFEDEGISALQALDQSMHHGKAALDVGQRCMTKYIDSLEGLSKSEQGDKVKRDDAADKLLLWSENHGVRDAIEKNAIGNRSGNLMHLNESD